MKLSSTQVARAHILHLLAVHRNISVDVAARMAGYAPETGQEIADPSARFLNNLLLELASQLVEPAEAADLAKIKEVSKEVPPEQFWYLRRREKLQPQRHKFQLPPEGDSSDLPPYLLNIESLRSEELNFPDSFEDAQSPIQESHATACMSFNSGFDPPNPIFPTLERSAKPDLTELVNTISKHHPLRRLLDNGRNEVAAQEHFQKNSEKKFRGRVHRLLGLLSVAEYAEPALLQAIMQLLPSPCSDAETEAAMLSHPDVRRYNDNTDNELPPLAVRLKKKAEYQQVVALENPSVQAGLLDAMRECRSINAPALFAVELLQSLQFLRPSDHTKYIDWLEAFILRFVRTWFERSDNSVMMPYARRLLRLCNNVLPQTIGKKYAGPSFLYGILHREALRAGAVIPPQYKPESVLRMVRRCVPPVRYLLAQRGEGIFFSRSTDADSATDSGPDAGSSIAANLTFSVDCLLLYRGGQVETLPVRNYGLICLLNSELNSRLNSGQDGFCLQTPDENLYISTCFRPSWSIAIGRNSKGLFADVPWLGVRKRLTWRNQATEAGRWDGDGSMRTDQYGLYVDLVIAEVAKIADRVIQRFRWIEPGGFMMGSPPDEPERESWGKESLHEVVLTKGFWLADTAVTQRLWEAVTGNNPSLFKGEEQPVENVSWHDVHHFFKKLNALIPCLAARLPTEAEWEYSCRAGTSTPFSFGAKISPEQVNYNGHYPYYSERAGRNRKQPVAVKSFPCNALGLYEMHGNVWEWCQDFWREDLRSDEPVIDPQGPETGDVCAVRGGSWFLSRRGVRSAVRGKFAPTFSNSRIGFRLALDQYVP